MNCRNSVFPNEMPFSGYRLSLRKESGKAKSHANLGKWSPSLPLPPILPIPTLVTDCGTESLLVSSSLRARQGRGFQVPGKASGRTGTHFNSGVDLPVSDETGRTSLLV